MWPVIIRELHAEARHPFTYWLRSLGAAALLLVGGYHALHRSISVVRSPFVITGGGTVTYASGGTFFAKGSSPSSMNEGGTLFARLHLTLFFAIWILGPLITADCISRERREGTLGLLFLTPLTARGIVLAKALAHGLRAMTMCLAVLPILTIPFLIGGVSWQQAVLSLATNFSSFCLALAAGFLASSWNKVWLRALAWAAMLALLFVVCFASLNCLLLTAAVSPYFRRPWILEDFFQRAYLFVSNDVVFWFIHLSGVPTAGLANLLWAAAAVGAISLLTLVVALQIAARNVRRRWQEEPPSARQVWLEQTFCTPVLWLTTFRRWMRWKLDHNPIGWLEQRTWSARLVTWTWLAVMISLLSMGLSDVHFLLRADGFSTMERLFAWLLAGSIAMSAAGSFRRERESGVLELLLVSPLRVAEIISGRLKGLWGQFIPASALLFASWLYLGSAFGRIREESVLSILFFAVTFMILPVVGLYFSLREGNFISALLWTAGVCVVLPLVLGEFGSAVVFWAMGTDESGRANVWQSIFPAGPFNWLTMILQIGIATFLRSRLHKNLSQRRFAFQHGSG